MAERLHLQCSAAPVRLRFALLPGRGTTHVIFKAAPKTGFRKRTLRFGGPRRLPASARARRPGSLRYNMLLCHLRRLHCHGVCYPDLALVRRPGGQCGTHHASLPASGMPTSAFTPAMTRRGGLTPKPPTHPPERRPRCGLAPLPVPKGGCAKGLRLDTLAASS